MPVHRNEREFSDTAPLVEERTRLPEPSGPPPRPACPFTKDDFNHDTGVPFVSNGGGFV